MAINDNETYGLKGSQVKDLANKIIHADNEVINLSGINNITTSNSDHQAVLLKIANAVLKHDVAIVTQTYGVTFRAPTRPARIRQNNNTYILTWSLTGLDNASNGSSTLGVGYNPHDQYTWSFYVLPGEVANGKITHVYASFSGGDTTLASNYSDGTVTPSTDSYHKLYTLSSTGLDKLVGKDNVNSWTPTTDYGLVHKKYVDDKIATGSGAPTTSTVGTVGQLLEDTTNGKLYICTAVVPGTDPDPTTYTWVEAGEKQIEVVTMSGFSFSPYYPNTPEFADFAVQSAVTNCSMTYAQMAAAMQAGKRVVAKITIAANEVTNPIALDGDYYVELNLDSSTNNDLILGFASVFGASSALGIAPLTMAVYADGSGNTDDIEVFAIDTNSIQLMFNEEIMSISSGNPSSSTAGSLGQLWRNSSTGKIYVCTAKTAQGTTPETYTYTWEEITTNGLQFKTLTAADVNFPVDNPSTVSLWRLPTGVYISGSSSVTMTMEDYTGGYYNPAYKLTPGKYAVVIRNPINNANADVYIYSSGEGVASGKVLNTTGSSSNKVIGPSKLADNLTTTDEYAALSAGQGKLLDQKIEGRVMTGSGAPTTSTTGAVGRLYEDTTNGNVYICTAASGGTYTWEKLAKTSELPVFTMTTTDPGEGSALADNHFIGVYEV